MALPTTSGSPSISTIRSNSERPLGMPRMVSQRTTPLARSNPTSLPLENPQMTISPEITGELLPCSVSTGTDRS